MRLAPFELVEARRRLKARFAPRRFSILRDERRAVGALFARDDVLKATYATYVERAEALGQSASLDGFLAWLAEHWLDVIRLILIFITIFAGRGEDIDAEMIACCARTLAAYAAVAAETEGAT